MATHTRRPRNVDVPVRKFPRATSRIASRLRAWSATMRLSRSASFSNSFMRFAPLAFMPSYCARQRWRVCPNLDLLRRLRGRRGLPSTALLLTEPPNDLFRVCRVAILRASCPQWCQIPIDARPVLRWEVKTPTPVVYSRGTPALRDGTSRLYVMARRST